METEFISQTETGNVQMCKPLVFMFMHKAVSNLRTEAVLAVMQPGE